MGIWLAMTTADGRERLYPIHKARTVIGKEQRCDLRVLLPSLANKHCEIVASRGHLIVRDLGSEVGTFINGERIRESSLHKLDNLRIGPVTFVLRSGKNTLPFGASTAPPNGV